MKVSSLLKAALALSLGILILGPAGIAQEATDASGVILVAGKGKKTEGEVAKLVRAYGKVVGKNLEGFYKVQLNSGIKADDAVRGLRRLTDVAGAFSEDALMVEPGSLPSLQEHMAYLRARHEAKGLTGKPKGLGYFEALEWYLKSRVGPDGKIDSQKMYEAMAHRDQMPTTPPPTTQSASMPGTIGEETIQGGWAYVGPRNTDLPQSQWYGTRPVSGRVNAIAVHPAQVGWIYAATAGGGVMKTTDGGVTWSPLSDGWELMETSSIALDPWNPNVIYVGTGDHHGFGNYGVGIMKSTDHGATWTNIGRTEMQGWAVSKIMINPDAPSQLIATTGRGPSYHGKVWRSSDGGTTWTRCVDTLGNFLPQVNWCDGDWSQKDTVTNVRNVYVVGAGASGGNIYRSINWGVSWSKVTSPVSGGIDVLDCAAGKRTSFTSALYVLVPERQQIWRSDNRGVNWINISAGFPNGTGSDPTYNWSQGRYDFHITTGVTDDNLSLIYVGLITLAVNVGGAANAWYDVGTTYQAVARTHNDQHAFFAHPSIPEMGWAGNDGGIYRLNLNVPAGGGNPGVAFTNLNRLLPITQFYSVQVHPTDTTWVMGGTQDNAYPTSRGDLLNWSNPGEGDGTSGDFMRTNPLRMFVGWQYQQIYRSNDGFATRSEITPNYGTDRVPFIGMMRTGPGTNADDLLVATNYLWKYDSNGSTWSPRIGGTQMAASDQIVSAIGAVDSNSSRLYTGTSDSRVWMSTTYGAGAWTQIDTATLPNRWVTDIVPRDGASYDILASLSSMSSGNLWRCADTDINPRTWTNVSGTGATALPSVPVNAVARDPFNINTFYAGTDVGCFMSTDGGATWLNITRPWGLPNVRVTDLKVFNSGGSTYLYAGTYGRGIWRIALRTASISSLSVISSIYGGYTTTGYMYFNGPTGPLNMTVSSNNTAAARVIGTIAVPANSTYKSFLVTTYPVSSDTTVTLSATYGGQTRSDAIIVKAPVLTSLVFNLRGSTVVGGNSFTGVVSINSNAPTGGLPINLSDQFTELWGYPTPVVTIPAGARSTSFPIKTNPVKANLLVTLTASRGVITKAASVTLIPGGLESVASLVAKPTGGNTFNGRVTLSGPAPFDTTVTLSTKGPFITVPPSVVVLKGATTADFKITSTAVTQDTLQIFEATLGNTLRRGSCTLIP